MKKYDRAFELNQCNVEHFPSDKYAMWSQVEIVKSHIRDGNDAAADAAFDKLLTVFSQQATLPKGVYQIAMRYNKSRKPDKALALHQYNVEHFPSDMYTMWSQVEIVKSHIRDANDAAADAACDKLLAAFSQQPTLPLEIYQLAMKFKKAGKEDRAFQLHQYNADHSSKDDMYTMWSQVEIVKSHIRDGNDAAADAACDKLLAAFSQQPTLPLEIYQLANKYDRDDKASQLYQYAITIDRSSTEEQAIWAQSAMIRSYHALGDDAAAEAAVDKLLANFSDNPLIARVVWEVGRYYHGLKKYDKASRLYQYVIDNQSKNEYAMRAKASMIQLNILLGNEAAVEIATKKMIADFNNHPDLSSVIFRTAEQIAQQYYSKARAERSEGHDEQAKIYCRKFIALREKIITELPPSAEYTPQAYYCLASCYSQESGEDDKAIEYYQKLLKNWPDFNYRCSSYAWFGIACCYEKLEKSGRIPTSEAAGQICHACEKLLTNYPDTNPHMIQNTRDLLKRYQVSKQ